MDDVEKLVGECDQIDALDHIMRTAKASRTQTRRLRWIAARAADALGLGEDWRDIDLPKSQSSTMRAERKRIIELNSRISTLESALAETFEQVYDNPHIDALVERVLSDQ